LEGSGYASNSEPPLVKKIRESVHYFILFYFNTTRHNTSISETEVLCGGGDLLGCYRAAMHFHHLAIRFVYVA
jgi:hypothetical protein